MPVTHWTDWIEYPHARERVIIEHHRGDIQRFFVQLEYRHADDDWIPVAHFDHNPAGIDGHDITEEGLHMDVYENGERHRVERGFPPVALSDAVDYCRSYLAQNADQLLPDATDAETEPE